MRPVQPLPPGRCIWVSLPKATFGLIVADGFVVAAAPYAWRYVGLREAEAARRLRGQGARFKALDQTR